MRAALAAGSRFRGRVRHGRRLGRRLGTPTANLALGAATPRPGVWTARVRVGRGPARPAIAYFGSRPTVAGRERWLEVHILDFAGDLYGAPLEAQLVRFIRPDRRFGSIAAMAAQIARDCDQARALLG